MPREAVTPSHRLGVRLRSDPVLWLALGARGPLLIYREAALSVVVSGRDIGDRLLGSFHLDGRDLALGRVKTSS